MTQPGALPLSVVSRALRATTERLARELAAPTDEPPEWNAWEWQVAQAVAAMHGVSPLLASTLRWRGLTQWQNFLNEQRAHTSARHARLTTLLGDIDHSLRTADIAALTLKGPALFARGIYVAGDRPMADIDLLVRERDLDASRSALAAIGYRQTFAISRHVVLKPQLPHANAAFGEHRDNPITIELHAHVGERLPLTDIDITRVLWPDAATPGLCDYASDTTLMTHLLLHAAANMRIRALRLLHLEDIARLAARMDAGAWDELVGENPGDVWWALPVLSLTARYRPACIPPQLLATLRPHCASWLRASTRSSELSDVSLSNPRVRAFAGILWAQSWSEMARYAAHRIRPDDATLAERRDTTHTQPWAEDGEWVRLSQGRRVLRWLVSRPRRIETMHAIRRATQLPAPVIPAEAGTQDLLACSMTKPTDPRASAR